MTGPGRRIDIKTAREDVSRFPGVRPGLGTYPHADQSVHRSGGSLSAISILAAGSGAVRQFVSLHRPIDGFGEHPRTFQAALSPIPDKEVGDRRYGVSKLPTRPRHRPGSKHTSRPPSPHTPFGAPASRPAEQPATAREPVQTGCSGACSWWTKSSGALPHTGCVLKRSTQQPRRTPEMVSSSQASVEALC